MKFVNACKNGDIELAKTLPSTIIARALAFKEACMNHQLDTMWWLIKTFPDDICGPHTDTLAMLCKAGYIDFSKYIHDTYPQYIDKVHLIAIVCCRLGHTDIIRWLVSLHDTINLDGLFKIALCNNQLCIAQWLYDTYPNIVFDDIFADVCDHGDLSAVVWLNSVLVNTLTNIQLEDAYVKACGSGTWIL